MNLFSNGDDDGSSRDFPGRPRVDVGVMPQQSSLSAMLMDDDNRKLPPSSRFLHHQVSCESQSCENDHSSSDVMGTSSLHEVGVKSSSAVGRASHQQQHHDIPREIVYSSTNSVSNQCASQTFNESQSIDINMNIQRLSLQDSTTSIPNQEHQEQQPAIQKNHQQNPNTVPDDECLKKQGNQCQHQRQHQVVPQSSTTAIIDPNPVSSVAKEREHFLIFIKILFKCLDQANNPQMRDRAKKIVAECTKRNRQGDPKFHPLMQAVELRLRGFVGEQLWRRSFLLLRHFIQTKE
jgi:hypothetical protein